MVIILSVLSGLHAVSFFSVPGDLSTVASSFVRPRPDYAGQSAEVDLGVVGDVGVYLLWLPRRISSTQDIAAMVVGKPMVLIASTPT
jgi:hypothetical protein